jgi:hypothetical protein
MFHLSPETQNLLMTVILMEAKQYASTESPGLFTMLAGAEGSPMLAEGLLSAGEERDAFVGISIE